MKLKKPNFWKSLNFLSIFLLPLSLITFIVILIKQIIVKKNKFEVPVICVGNIFLGGTGKTPLSIYIYNFFLKKKMRPAIIRKYYSSHHDEINLTKSKVKNFFVENSRYTGIKKAEKNDCNVVILDDGLQDFSIEKKINIVCFNANELKGNGFLLPAGPLRSPLSNLKQAKIIVINGNKNLFFEKELRLKSPKAKIFYSSYIPTNLRKFAKKRILAFAGIGNPTGFFDMLKEYKLNVCSTISFPDHYNYNKNEISDLVKKAKIEKMKLVTTEKDYHRIKNLGFTKIDYISINLKINKEESFKKTLVKNL